MPFCPVSTTSLLLSPCTTVSARCTQTHNKSAAQTLPILFCRQLVAAWVAVVQDYAVLGTHGPLVQAAYTPRLFPAPSLSIIARLQPNLQSCWPSALRALAVALPQAAGRQLPLLIQNHCKCLQTVHCVLLRCMLTVHIPVSPGLMQTSFLHHIPGLTLQWRPFASWRMS